MNKAPDGAKEVGKSFFCRPCRGSGRSVRVPTVLPRATFWRASGAVMAVMFFSIAALAQTTNGLSNSEVQGQQLARTLANTRPNENFTNTGILQVRNAQGPSIPIHVQFSVSVYGTNWEADYGVQTYNTVMGDKNLGMYYRGWSTIVHSDDQPNIYRAPNISRTSDETNKFIYILPFAGSDFWLADLGLEFFHWPSQKIVKKEFSRGRGCMVLESVNPDPTNGYSKVDSWIDEESYGIVHAEAFDPKGKLLKVFDPKSFKKVNGQWQLEGMEIRNVQTGSRTRIEFNLKEQPGSAGVSPAR